ncbi:LysR family transcriptional regulator (plasmid) [Pseudohalocynthiibacter aestuariivivens]|nr:LysR family transcriptional regulator [Pseudohalocynthiibacter aestuariivivens]
MQTFLNLQTDLLRTFISVVELGGHTKAGQALGRSQPAISLQMHRLENLVGVSLLAKEGRKIILTRDGEALLSFARDIVRLNDEAVQFFRHADLSGVLRIGLPTDYAMAFLQNALASFTQQHPDVELEVRCDLSRELHRQLRANELDIIVAVMPKAQMPYVSRSWIEQPVWAAASDMVIDPEKPVPLAAHPEGCDYRERMIEALHTVGQRWRIVYTGSGISGLQKAVQSGFCVSALTQPTLLEGMRTLGAEDGLPPLEPLRVGLLYKHPQLTDAGVKLVSELVSKLDTIGVSERAEPA